jgi:hypothetical protein
MKQREKSNDETSHPAEAGDPGNAGLTAAQKKMSELLTAGDAAINSALSGDSAAFLAANQQRGGQ